MKILWITNIPFGPHAKISGQVKVGSGLWLGAAYEAIKNEDSIELFIATVSRVNEIKRIKDGRHTFLFLPGGYPIEYNPKESKNRRIWERIRNEIGPDLIQVWGYRVCSWIFSIKSDERNSFSNLHARCYESNCTPLFIRD
ncbi:MAG: hypothetical protein AB2L24_17960 [Mangrovibacterium sp.]